MDDTARNEMMREINRLRAIVREFGRTAEELEYLGNLLGVERPESDWTPEWVEEMIISAQGLLARQASAESAWSIQFNPKDKIMPVNELIKRIAKITDSADVPRTGAFIAHPDRKFMTVAEVTDYIFSDAPLQKTEKLYPHEAGDKFCQQSPETACACPVELILKSLQNAHCACRQKTYDKSNSTANQAGDADE